MNRIMRSMVALVMAAGIVGGAQASSAAAATRQSGTWVGEVERHENHYDYVGRACPVEVEFCIAVVARYRIAPVTWQARQALPAVAGQMASLEGSLVHRAEREHQGILLIKRVTPAPTAT